VRVLVLNAGSSSLKASVLETDGLKTLARTEALLGADAVRAAGRRRSVRQVLGSLQRDIPVDSVGAVGHRVVHGGTLFRDAVRIDARVLAGIERLAPFAPLHNRVAVDTIRAAQAMLPRQPHVAAFDNAFHAALPKDGFIYPVPYGWYRQWGIRRFGFHGLSVSWAVERSAALLRRPAGELALLVAHLGSGCSVTAVLNGRSTDTSMGLTPMDGLMMGTRSGSIDPGILLFLMRTRRLGWRALEDGLDHHAGLVGVSGRRVGMRELEQAAAAGDQRATLAITLFVRRAAAGIAAAATALPRIDALVFTGGIGEHAGRVRAAVVGRLAPLRVPPIRADSGGQDGLLTAPGRRPAVLRIEAREDAMVARQAEALLAPSR